MCISAYGQGESCTVLLWNDEILQWPKLGQFLTNSSLLMKSTLELLLGFGAYCIKINVLTLYEMILSVCIMTWELSGVHINNIYLHSCFPQGAPGVTSVRVTRLGGALRESCQAPSLDSTNHHSAQHEVSLGICVS